MNIQRRRETAEYGVRAPGDLSWKRPGEMVQITANIQIPDPLTAVLVQMILVTNACDRDCQTM